MGLHREGIKLVEEALRILELLGNVVGEAVCLMHLASLCVVQMLKRDVYIIL